ncbi:MAG: T4SS-associated protein EirA [Gammaproteobacteria bacterium]|nr:T4SS-associated protein EirA [Gammaproteobacteria bacterium]
MRIKYYVLGIIAVVAIAAMVYIFFIKPSSNLERFAAMKPVAEQSSNDAPATTTNEVSQQAQYCPQPDDLVKNGVDWTTKDKKWKNYTPSSATKILSFIGAQWVGVKVGKVICLYQTNEAVSFPVALEQTKSQLVLEPREGGWSALVNNRRFCKSSNVVDCPIFHEAAKALGNIYEEIKYDPKSKQN